MFGNLDQHKEELELALSQIKVTAESGDGLIKMEANGNREVINISISPEIFEGKDNEELEDLLMVAVNRLIQKATAAEAEVSQKMMSKLLPPGMENLFG